jgi:hypothetical protein
MTELIHELGPVDWLVVQFPASRFNGEIAPTITDLVDRAIVRILDLLVLERAMPLAARRMGPPPPPVGKDRHHSCDSPRRRTA